MIFVITATTEPSPDDSSLISPSLTTPVHQASTEHLVVTPTLSSAHEETVTPSSMHSTETVVESYVATILDQTSSVSPSSMMASVQGSIPASRSSEERIVATSSGGASKMASLIESPLSVTASLVQSSPTLSGIELIGGGGVVMTTAVRSNTYEWVLIWDGGVVMTADHLYGFATIIA